MGHWKHRQNISLYATPLPTTHNVLFIYIYIYIYTYIYTYTYHQHRSKPGIIHCFYLSCLFCLLTRHSSYFVYIYGILKHPVFLLFLLFRSRLCVPS